MGKRDKKKGKGMEKTLAKTEKNLTKKLKRQSGKLREENIELVVKRLSSEASNRRENKETKCEPPSPRTSFSLVVHPERDELFLFGGEFYDGRHMTVYDDLLMYRVKTDEWRHLQLACSPAARAGHAAAVTALGGGQMWMFGGEYVSVSGEQFHHYSDLWCLHLTTKRWQKISTEGVGPSARSGHRMASVCGGHLLLLFGGFHDSSNGGGVFHYMNDLYALHVHQRAWVSLSVTGVPPSPRSSVLLASISDDRLLVYGGYSKLKNCSSTSAAEEGVTHTDMFHLVPQRADGDNETVCVRWRWTAVRQSGVHPPVRGGMSGCVTSGDRLLMFGGVSDQQNEHSLTGTFYNDLYWLDAARGHWRMAEVRARRQQARRRRKQHDSVAATGHDEVSDPDPADLLDERLSVTSCSDTADCGVTQCHVTPSVRTRAVMVHRAGKVYLYGGHVERATAELTLADFYSLDVGKMDQWKTLVEQSQEINWHESDDDDEEHMDDEDDSDDEDSDDTDDDNTDDDMQED